MKESEKEFVENKLIPILEKHFIVRKECRSECGKYRIDLILQLKYSDVFFGVECKVPNAKRGEEIGRYVKQAASYKTVKFDIYKDKSVYQSIPIFICPALSYNYFIYNHASEIFEHESNMILSHGVHDKWHKDKHDQFCTHHAMNGFLGSAFGIGEIRSTYHNNFNFMLSNYVIFSSGFGLHRKNYSKL